MCSSHGPNSITVIPHNVFIHVFMHVFILNMFQQTKVPRAPYNPGIYSTNINKIYLVPKSCPPLPGSLHRRFVHCTNTMSHNVQEQRCLMRPLHSGPLGLKKEGRKWSCSEFKCKLTKRSGLVLKWSSRRETLPSFCTTCGEKLSVYLYFLPLSQFSPSGQDDLDGRSVENSSQTFSLSWKATTPRPPLSLLAVIE